MPSKILSTNPTKNMLWTIAKLLQDFSDWVYTKVMHIIITNVSGEFSERYMKTGSLEQLGNAVWYCHFGRNMPPQFNKLLEVPGIENGKARWFGKALNRNRDDPILVLFHGGGYCFDMTRQHGMALKEIWDTVDDHRMSIVWLDYTKSSKARLPKQLEEAMALYTKVLEVGDNITIMGDSAGGHLALCLCREATRRGMPLPNLVLCSPWLRLLPDLENLPDRVKNDTIDIMTPRLGFYFGSKVLPLDNPELLSEVADLSILENWDQYLPSSDRIFISYGEYELLRDEIADFLKNTNLQRKGATVYMEPHGIHDSFYMLGCGPWRIGLNPVIKEVCHFLEQLKAKNDLKEDSRTSR